MEKTITQRRATHADIPFIARIYGLSWEVPIDPPIWSETLKGLVASPQLFFETMFAAEASVCGAVEDFTILEYGGVPTAACALYVPQPHRPDKRALDLEKLPDIAYLLGWGPETTAEFLARYERLWGPAFSPFFAPHAYAMIDSVGVLPEARGLGLGKALIRAVIALAGRCGYPDIGITLVRGNTPAEKLYESTGFKPYMTYHADCFDDTFEGLIKYRLRPHSGAHIY